MAEGKRFTPIAQIGLPELIERLKRMLPAAEDPVLVQGIGDDAAVYRVHPGRVHLLSAGFLLEGVHFDPALTPFAHLGAKVMVGPVSNVVAMNGRPRYALVAIAVPNQVSVEMLEELYRGLQRACALYGCALVGGQTVPSPRGLELAITVVGEAAESAVTYRRGACPGDLVCVSGDLGGAYAGLQILLREKDRYEAHPELGLPDLSPYRYVVERQLVPLARLDVVVAFEMAGVLPRAMTDISQGLAAALHALCRASGVGARIRASAIPIDLATRAVAEELDDDPEVYALYGGEDYELLFALAESDWPTLEAVTQAVTVIGRFTEASEGIQIEYPDGRLTALEAHGWKGPSSA
ncbi:MAG: thiamine-phosphate kinase [Bacteroidetes bacterium]|nr:thiamine-phosphate kinase [Rhodothermia bacterium]MCS7155557.1 thiamine-phosphate kinase [Bacteroidota bacterium]MCX7906415.1 thiamine-phosphate kinase [Bacteroidota bacterium]MDW8137303.1 thiamine-phosphate kinase [Bacteroidota bacterium]MDW8284827.1 thiamine-phosphate kinase [Bacteroidota bacterium]